MVVILSYYLVIDNVSENYILMKPTNLPRTLKVPSRDSSTQEA
jgi:hypothetical protein